jgi:hypothetical protein
MERPHDIYGALTKHLGFEVVVKPISITNIFHEFVNNERKPISQRIWALKNLTFSSLDGVFFFFFKLKKKKKNRKKGYMVCRLIIY